MNDFIEIIGVDGNSSIVLKRDIRLYSDSKKLNFSVGVYDDGCDLKTYYRVISESEYNRIKNEILPVKVRGNL